MVIHPIQRSIFAKALGVKFLPEEKKSANKRDLHWHLCIFQRIFMVLDVNLVKFNNYGDLCIMCPLMVVCQTVGRLLKGDLVIPIKKVSKWFTCVRPCFSR